MGSTYPLWDLRLLSSLSKFQVDSVLPDAMPLNNMTAWQDGSDRRDVVRFRYKGQELEMFAYYFRLLLLEWFLTDAWETHYVPDSSLKGKVVMDVGAGCGESVLFFLEHGARRVVAVEPWAPARDMLVKNVTKNGWPVEVVGLPFNLDMLERYPHDFLKVDAEGDEVVLADVATEHISPCAVESHSAEITAKLMKAHPRFRRSPVKKQESWLSMLTISEVTKETMPW